MRNKLYILSLIAVTAIGIIIPGCKKYDDGPRISLRTKKARVVGEWKVDEVYINGANQTQSYLTNIIEFEKDGDYKEIYAGGAVTGKWEFSSGKESIDISLNGGGAYRYDILRLTKNEFWAEVTGVGRAEFHLEKK